MRLATARASFGGCSYRAPVGVQGLGDTMRSILEKRREHHSNARPVFPGSHGLWLLQQQPAPPLGHITTRSSTGRWVFDVCAHCRDDNDCRPWLRAFCTLNAAVAWTVQHEAEIRALIERSSPEPEAWPGTVQALGLDSMLPPFQSKLPSELTRCSLSQ